MEYILSSLVDKFPRVSDMVNLANSDLMPSSSSSSSTTTSPSVDDNNNSVNNGDVVTVKYTTSAGVGANGLKVFENIGTYRDNLGNAITSGITITAVSFPDGGAEPESTEAIKFSAPSPD